MIRRSKSSITIHDRLHHEASDLTKQREELQKKQLAKVCTFRPVRSRSPMRNKQNKNLGGCQRLNKVMPREPPPTFKPTVTHDQYYKRVARKQEIQDYAIAQQILHGKLRLPQKNKSKSPRTQPIPPAQPKQSAERQQMEELTMKMIFQLLDDDKDDLISARQINFEHLDLNILEIISCVLIEMEANSRVYDFLDFYAACIRNNIARQLTDELQKSLPERRMDFSRQNYEQIVTKTRM